MKYRLAIFDMDGTILDTLTDIADSTNATLEVLGLPTRSLDEVRQFVGNGIRLLIERAVAPVCEEAAIEEAYRIFRAHYAEHCADKTAPYEGIPELLADLRAAGCHTAVLSNKADEPVKALAEQYFPGAFELALGQREGVPIKPAPDGVLDVLKAFGVPPEQAVYIGDSEVDVQTAINAGIDGLFVSFGFRSEEALRAAGATCVLPSVAELKKALLQ